MTYRMAGQRPGAGRTYHDPVRCTVPVALGVLSRLAWAILFLTNSLLSHALYTAPWCAVPTEL
jgi:hypothetical protein